MTIPQLGQLAIQKSDKYSGLPAARAGQQLLADHPQYWGQVDDTTVATHLNNLKNAKYKETSGIFAFFSKLGEKQRAEFFEKRVQTSKALVELQAATHQIRDMQLKEQLSVATTAQAIATAKFQIHKLGLDAGRAELAAESGHSLEIHDALNLEGGRAALNRQNVEHGFGLDTKARDQVHSHGTEDRNLDSNIRIRESQSNHLLGKEMEELRHQLTSSLKDQEHRHTTEVENLRHQLHLKEKEYDHRQRQDEIDREVQGTIKLANTSELSRAQQIQMLLDYSAKMEAAGSEFSKSVYRREIARLEKELYGQESGGVAGKAYAGKPEPEGGNQPPDSGNEYNPPQKPRKQSDTGTDTGFIN